ncbi:MAG: chromosome segregation protein SMC [bacterium]
MQLVSVEVSGFKSFPKATKLTFSGGVTAIVGPNGCGKTNIVDAIRWALGEQKTSVLRSDRMDNVIFNGTATRKPIGMAEVAMAINNSDGALPTPYTEVEIKRRIYRDGGSEYFLNGILCRLKDVVELLQDTGLGPDTYSILELRMVEDILREGGDGRRHLFEEVAGVAKYKSRRQQAQLKLQQTEEDLQRLADILSEVERRVSSLKRQVARARRYQRLKAELTSCEVAILWRDYERLRTELAPLEEEMKRTSDTSVAARSLLRAEEAHVEELRTAAIAIEKELVGARGVFDGFVKEIGALETENASLDARASALQDTLRHAERTSILLREKRELLGQKSKFQETERQKLSQAFRPAQEELAAAQEEYKEQERTLEECLHRIRHHEEYLSSLQTEVTAKGRQLSSREAAYAGHIGRQEVHQQELTQLLEQEKTLTMELQQVAQSEAGLRQHLEKLRQEQGSLRQKHEVCTEELKRTAANLHILRQTVNLTLNKIDLLQTLSERSPRSHPALKFLREKSVAGLLDLLGDTLDVPERYERAFAAILGPAAYYCLVESAEAALRAIEALRQSGTGQAVFVSVDSPPSPESPPMTLPEGILGRAVDFLNGHSAHPIALHFLGQVVIAKDWETLCSLRDWGREHELTLVSLNGEWITPQGVMCGGAMDTRVPADIGLKRQIGALRQQLEEAQTELAAMEKSGERMEAESNSIEQEQSEVQERIAALEADMTLLHEKQLQKSILRQHQKERCTTIEKELATLSQAIRAASVEVEESVRELTSAQENLEKAAASDRDLDAEVTQARKRALTSKERYHRAERQCDEARHRLQLAEVELQGILASISEITTEIQTNDERAAQAHKDEGEVAERKREVEARLLEGFRHRDESSLAVEQQGNRLDEARERIRQQEEKLRAIRGEREEGLEGERRLEREIARLQAERDATLAAARSKFSLDLSTPDFAAAHSDIVSAETGEQRVTELTAKIEQLGPVNLLAIEEYEQENERWQRMLANRDDLLKAKATLKETISRINETAQAQFLEIFTKVRANFQRLFREFFGSGEADLILSGTDLLEADVTLWANPSGKRLKSLSLMSGGEKAMTAIALLFALYQVKPSPFCILDEVDAPLDDANITRFNEMIRHHAEETQFILVTHNKRTMEAADTLWGVTMEEDGVSKVVSVRLVEPN